jgi:outer membrane protein TolC
MKRLCATILVVFMAISATSGQVRIDVPLPKEEPPFVDKIAVPTKESLLAHLQADARQNNVDIKVAQAKMRLAEAELERAKTLKLPNIEEASAKVRDAAAQVDQERKHVERRVAAHFSEFLAYQEAERASKKLLDEAASKLEAQTISAKDYAAAALNWAQVKSNAVAANEKIRLLVGHRIEDYRRQAWILDRK